MMMCVVFLGCAADLMTTPLEANELAAPRAQVTCSLRVEWKRSHVWACVTYRRSGVLGADPTAEVTRILTSAPVIYERVSGTAYDNDTAYQHAQEAAMRLLARDDLGTFVEKPSPTARALREPSADVMRPLKTCPNYYDKVSNTYKPNRWHFVGSAPGVDALPPETFTKLGCSKSLLDEWLSECSPNQSGTTGS